MVYTDDTELGVGLGLFPKFDGRVYIYVLNCNYTFSVCTLIFMNLLLISVFLIKYR